MAVCANETWGLLFWLSRGGAKESKLKEIKGEGEGTKTKKVLYRKRGEERTSNPNTTTIILVRDLTNAAST